MLANVRPLATAALLIGLCVLSGPGPGVALAAPAQHPLGVPNAPDGCSVVIQPTGGFGGGPGLSAFASWVDNSENEAGFEVQWKSTKPKSQGTFIVGPNTTSVGLVTNLMPGTKVFARVRAFNAAGSSPWSSWASSS